MEYCQRTVDVVVLNLPYTSAMPQSVRSPSSDSSSAACSANVDMSPPVPTTLQQQHSVQRPTGSSSTRQESVQGSGSEVSQAAERILQEQHQQQIFSIYGHENLVRPHTTKYTDWIVRMNGRYCLQELWWRVQSMWWELQDRGLTDRDTTGLLVYLHGCLRQLAASDGNTDDVALLQMLHRMHGGSIARIPAVSQELAVQCDQLGLSKVQAMLSYGPRAALRWSRGYIDLVAYVARLLSVLHHVYRATVRYRERRCYWARD
jgi:hypothetical protein